MTEDINVELVGMDELQAFIQQLPRRQFDLARVEFGAAASRVHRKVSERVRDGAGDTLHSRSGQLRRSLQHRVYGKNLKTLGSLVLADSSFAPYAPTHEFGALITAKRAYRGLAGGPYLNIPAAANKTPAGVQRRSARDVFAAGGYIIPINGAKARYAVKLGTEVMFWLVKSVKIPARLQLHKTGKDEIPTLLSNLAVATGKAIQ